MDREERKAILQVAKQLGVAADDGLVGQVSEYLRLIRLKSLTVTASETTRVAVCVDLVSELRGNAIELTDILTVTGTRKANYISVKRLFEKLLCISKVTGINEICIQLGLSEAKVEAEKILKLYQKATGSDLNDLKHPQYATMAVYMACKKQKLKASKQKFLPLSRLKSAQWTILEKQFEKVLSTEDLQGESVKSSKSTGKENQMEVDDDESGGGAKQKQTLENDQEEEEDYQQWKARILKKAYKDLKRMEKEGVDCPSD